MLGARSAKFEGLFHLIISQKNIAVLLSWNGCICQDDLWQHKGLAELFEDGRTKLVRQDLQSRCLRRLEVLDQAELLSNLNVPGFHFHGLHGKPKRYRIHVNGRGVSPLSGKMVKHCGSILNNIIEVHHGRISR